MSRFPTRRESLGVVVIGVLLVAVTVAVGYVIGRAATGSSSFAWVPASAAATAAGTTLLAVVTALLALSTQRSVRLEAQIAAETYRPVLIEPTLSRDIRYSPETGGGWFRVQLSNVGGGPALTVLVSGTFLETIPPAAYTVTVGTAMPTAIRAGETAQFEIPFSVEPPQAFEAMIPDGGVSGAYRFAITAQCRDRTNNGVTEPLALPRFDPL